MKFLDWLNAKLTVVPPDLYDTLSDAQKIVFVTNPGVIFLLAVLCLYLLFVVGRSQRVPNTEKEDHELDTKIGEGWHDDLVNYVNNGEMTKKQYKKYCRIMSLILPGAQYGHTASERLRKLFQVQQIKKSIIRRLLTGWYQPTEGYKAFTTKVHELHNTKPEVKKSRFSNPI